MKTRITLVWLTLTTVILVGYQNCGSFATDPLLKATSDITSTGPTSGIGFDASYTDGFALGTTQTGALFARDPASAAGNDRLSFAADFSPYVAQTTIKHLDGSKSYLADSYIKVNQDDFYSGTYADPNSSLVFPQTDQRFQQVNAFFHADRVIAELSGLSLFPGGSYSPIAVKAHCNQADNAYFDLNARTLCLGYSTVGGKKVWAADDTDVITHEFGHSLNHLYSPDPILYSSPEMGALDEAFADLWAYRNSKDARVSVWYGRAIIDPNGSGSFAGLRNLDSVQTYPNDVLPEVHADSLFLSPVVKGIEAAGALNTTQMATFEKHILESLQLGHGFTDVIDLVQSEATNYNVTTAQVNALLSARGLLRKDLVSEIALDGTKPWYVVDNHYDSNLASTGGNCNGILDSGERAIFMPNLRNSGQIKGGIIMSLVSNTTGVTVLNGGDYAFDYRIPAGTTYVAGEMAGYPSGDKTDQESDYTLKLTSGAFYIQASSTFSGTASLTLNVKTMNTQDGVAQTTAIPISLTVGTTATASSCSSSAGLSVFP